MSDQKNLFLDELKTSFNDFDVLYNLCLTQFQKSVLSEKLLELCMERFSDVIQCFKKLCTSDEFIDYYRKLQGNDRIFVKFLFDNINLYQDTLSLLRS